MKTLGVLLMIMIATIGCWAKQEEQEKEESMDLKALQVAQYKLHRTRSQFSPYAEIISVNACEWFVAMDAYHTFLKNQGIVLEKDYVTNYELDHRKQRHIKFRTFDLESFLDDIETLIQGEKHKQFSHKTNMERKHHYHAKSLTPQPSQKTQSSHKPQPSQKTQSSHKPQPSQNPQPPSLPQTHLQIKPTAPPILSFAEVWRKNIAPILPTQSRYTVGKLFENKQVRRYLKSTLQTFYVRDLIYLQDLVRQRRGCVAAEKISYDHILVYAWTEFDLLVEERIGWLYLCDIRDGKNDPERLINTPAIDEKQIVRWKSKHLKHAKPNFCISCHLPTNDKDAFWCDEYQVDICDNGKCVKLFEALLLDQKAPILWSHHQ